MFEIDYPWPVYSNELMHHGVKGQKWGIRRYQNEDGTLTRRGKKKYGRETKAAQQILKEDITRDQSVTKKSANRARKLEKKLDKADAAGNEAKSQKIMKKLTMEYNKGLAAMARLGVNQKTLKEINNGTLLAGRDFTASIKTIAIPAGSTIIIQKQKNLDFYTKEQKAQLSKEGKLRK